MFTLSTRRPADRRTRLQLETIEDRTTPTTFSYSQYIASVQGLNIVVPPPGPAATFVPPSPPQANYTTNQWFTLSQQGTGGDTDYHHVSFSFTDNSPDPETVYLLVYRKMDNSYPNSVVASQQVLVASPFVVTSATSGGTYTLEADLPACGFQIDAAVIPGVGPGGAPLPLSPATATMPAGYQTALNIPWAGALGANDCPGGTEGGPDQGITRTQGYWKNHSDAWPVDSLTLGTVSYTKAELLTILNTPVRGNGAIALAHQLIAAKLNIAAGADPFATTVAQINAADALLGNGDLRLGFTLPTSQTSTLTGQLDAFNQSGDV